MGGLTLRMHAIVCETVLYVHFQMLHVYIRVRIRLASVHRVHSQKQKADGKFRLADTQYKHAHHSSESTIECRKPKNIEENNTNAYVIENRTFLLIMHVHHHHQHHTLCRHCQGGRMLYRREQHKRTSAQSYTPPTFNRASSLLYHM